MDTVGGATGFVVTGPEVGNDEGRVAGNRQLGKFSLAFRQHFSCYARAFAVTIARTVNTFRVSAFRRRVPNPAVGAHNFARTVHVFVGSCLLFGVSSNRVRRRSSPGHPRTSRAHVPDSKSSLMGLLKRLERFGRVVSKPRTKLDDGVSVFERTFHTKPENTVPTSSANWRDSSR